MLVQEGCRISSAVVKKDVKAHFRMKTVFPLYLKLGTRNILSLYTDTNEASLCYECNRFKVFYC